MNALDPLAWSILLMLVGCVVLVLEVFIPSGGLLAVLSAAAFIASIVIAFQRGPVTGFSFLMTTVVAVPLVLVLAFHYWPKTKIGKAFLGELPRDEDVLPDDPHRALVGRVGVARSKMLPSGAVEIDGQMVDAVSQGQAIEPGQNVVVTEVRANRVVVRPAKENERPGRSISTADLLSRPIEELGIESLEDPLA
ncbi:MAG: NfeD family protein [Pirellulales bacterium]